MKKMIFSVAVAMAMVASVSMFAHSTQSGNAITAVPTGTTVEMEGTHCNGTVGCSCPGFSPITNGDVWQQSYCRHCGHKKNYHK